MTPVIFPLSLWRSVVGALLLLPIAVHAQSDRPCGAPFMGNSTSCDMVNKLVLTGSSFQADATIPVGCTNPYTTDVWVQVVAPSATPNLAVGTHGPVPVPYPTQLLPLIYQSSPDCSTLVNVGGCPTLCAFAVFCLEFDGEEGNGVVYRFSGLTAGAPYWLRLLWNPSPDPAPDTVFIAFQDGPCVPCDPCTTPGSPLAADNSQLHAAWEGSHVALNWYIDHEAGASLQLYHSADASDWEPREANFEWNGDHYSLTDVPPPSTNGHFYQVRENGIDGEEHRSNIVQLTNSPGAWLRSQIWRGDVLELETMFDCEATLRLHDLQGRLLWETTLTSGVHKVSIPRDLLSNGLMLLRPSGALPMTAKALLPH